MYDGEDTQMTPPVEPTAAPQEETAMPQEAEQASEAPAQA